MPPPSFVIIRLLSPDVVASAYLRVIGKVDARSRTPNHSQNEENKSQASWRSNRAPRAGGSSASPRGGSLGRGSVAGAYANRAPGLRCLDRLSQATGDPQTPDRKSLREYCRRKATPLLLRGCANGFLQSHWGRPDGEGPVGRAHADRAEGPHRLDRIDRSTRDP